MGANVANFGERCDIVAIQTGFQQGCSQVKNGMKSWGTLKGTTSAG